MTSSYKKNKALYNKLVISWLSTFN